MSATGRGAKRAEGDFYATPAWCVRAIVPHLPPAHTILEPSAGEGAIVAVFAETYPGAQIVAIEADEGRAAKLEALAGVRVLRGDTLEITTDTASALFCAFDLVIGNPPYNAAERHVCAARLAAKQNGTVAMLLRLNWLEGQKRAEFHKRHPADVFVLPRRPSFTNKGTDATAYAWFVWGPGRGGRWSVLNLEGV